MLWQRDHLTVSCWEMGSFKQSVCTSRHHCDNLHMSRTDHESCSMMQLNNAQRRSNDPDGDIRQIPFEYIDSDQVADVYVTQLAVHQKVAVISIER